VPGFFAKRNVILKKINLCIKEQLSMIKENVSQKQDFKAALKNYKIIGEVLTLLQRLSKKSKFVNCVKFL